MTPNTTLAEDFQEAHKLMSSDGRDWAAITALGDKLHLRLAQEGDATFSSVLRTVPEMKRVSVVNVMGFLNPEKYDPYPKTQNLLSSAPKI